LSVDIIHKYFPGISQRQAEQFGQLGELYSWWNERINLISRKDMENLYERHVLYSLSIARVFSFSPGTRILDAGTGGGFPGIPLAIIFPDCPFLLVDSTAKKLLAAGEIADAIGLENVQEKHLRLEELQGNFDFIISRALASLPVTVNWVMKNIAAVDNNDMVNGLIYLKGGDFEDELRQVNYRYKVYPVKDFFKEMFFETKKIIHVFK
jgi:16S rRNA (guanine527-N7)-methyltransferase